MVQSTMGSQIPIPRSFCLSLLKFLHIRGPHWPLSTRSLEKALSEQAWRDPPRHCGSSQEEKKTSVSLEEASLALHTPL